MRAAVERERRLVEYLLGGLPPDERARTEEQLFVDDGLNEESQATADDLVHAYLAGELSQEDRERFEIHFLASPRRRQRLEFVRGLVAAADRVSAAPRASRSRSSHVWRPGVLSAAAALILATILTVLLRTSPPEGQRASAGPEPVNSPTLSPRPQKTPLPQRPKPQGVSTARLVRDAASPASVAVTPDTRVVRLEVVVAEDRPSYGAVLRTEDGKEVWRAEGLAPSTPDGPLVVAIPARVFSAEAYTLTVEGEALRGAPSQRLLNVQYRLRILRDH